MIENTARPTAPLTATSSRPRDIPRGRYTHDNHELVPDGTELWWCATCEVHVRRRGDRRPAPAAR